MTDANSLWAASSNGSDGAAAVTVTARPAGTGDDLATLTARLQADFAATAEFEELERLEFGMFGGPAVRIEGVFTAPDGEMRYDARAVTLTEEADGARVIEVLGSCSAEHADAHAFDIVSIIDALQFAR